MTTYQWAERNGTIVEADYNRVTDSLTTGQVRAELVDALNVFGNNVTCRQISTDLNEVYEVTIPNGNEAYTVFISIKEMTPGGRDNLMDEQRIQQKSKHLNFAYSKLQEGNKAVSLGVYKRNGETIFCAWKLKYSQAASPETPISKQIKITSIAHAMREGFVQQVNRHGEYTCAFRKEFIYFYIKNSDWLHNGRVTELNERTLPLTEAAHLTGDLKDKYNRILFGAPGTGKSHKLKKDCEENFDVQHYERVTFHPNYTYAQFVGTYKPVPTNHGDISYKYIPGPFIRVLVKALQNPNECQLLIIEEINRANVAAVFGDVFQLLDRKDGVSEYPIETSEDLRNYLTEVLGEPSENYAKLYIPQNMYIWATMNSADQGVFPMDTAFKRRWDFEYIGINEGSAVIADKPIELLGLGYRVQWNNLRTEINRILIENCKINEDKLIGPFFLGLNVLDDAQKFNEAFKSKLLMYLYEDAAKQHRRVLFNNCDSGTYSSVCDAFDQHGEAIFGLSLEIGETEEAAATVMEE